VNGVNINGCHVKAGKGQGCVRSAKAHIGMRRVKTKNVKKADKYKETKPLTRCLINIDYCRATNMPETLKPKQTQQPITKRDWTLLVIDAAKPNTLTPIQLQKALFLLSQNLPKETGKHFYHFVPHNFGPFAKEIYDDASKLREEGLIDEISRPDQNWPEYRISVTGTERANEIRKSLPPNSQEYIKRLVEWIGRQSFSDLLHSVYKAYPEFAKNSVFNG
jgi:uncharacterized protein